MRVARSRRMLLHHQAAEAVQPLTVIPLGAVLAVAIDDVEHARGAIERLSLVAAENLYQAPAAARMGRTYVDLQAMAMVGRFHIDQQGLGTREAEPVAELDARRQERLLAA